MIKEIKFKNVLSFKEETKINFQKVDSLKESDEYIINNGASNYLKFLVTYGKNGGGKTNLLLAIKGLYLFVESDTFPFVSLINSYNNLAHYSSENEPIEFEIIFTVNNNENTHFEYRYGFSFDKNEILSENLFLKINGKKEVKIFEKNKENKGQIEKIVSSKNFKSAPGLFANLPKNKLLLNVAANVGEENSSVVAASILNKLIAINIDLKDPHFLNVGNLEQDQIDSITKFIHEIDINEVEKIILKEQTFLPQPSNPFGNQYNNSIPQKKKVPYFISNGKEIHLSHLSAGTRKMIGYLSLIFLKINRFKNTFSLKEFNTQNFLIVIDEFEAGIHPKILKNLINEILLKIKEMGFEKNIQLLLTTHNPLLLGNESLRRDQVILIDKENHNSFITPLSDQSVRKDLNLAKAYMEGKLGGIPNIEELLCEDKVKDAIKKEVSKALESDKNFTKLMEKLANS